MKTTESKNDPFGNNEQEGNPNKPHIEIVKAMKFLNDAGFQVIPNKMVLGEPFGKADEFNYLFNYEPEENPITEWLDESIEPCATSSDYMEEIERLRANVTFWKDKYHAEALTPSPTGDRDCEELKKENQALKQRISEIVYLSEQKRKV